MRTWIQSLKRAVPVIVKDRIKMLNYRRRIHYRHPIKNPKMVVVFLVARANVFNSVKSVFEAARRNQNVDAYLVALPNRANDKGNLDTAEVYAFCKALAGENAINSYDSVADRFFDLRTLNPDYVFLCAPYNEEYPTGYQFLEMAQYTKLCFIPYGYAFLEGVTNDTGLNVHMMGHVSFLFADGKLTYQYCKERIKYIHPLTKQRIVSLGFPRFDLYNNLPRKHDTVKQVLYLPRWTAPQNIKSGHEPSSFMLFKDKILDWAEANPEFLIKIRPHPILFYRYVVYGLMTEDDVRAYRERIEKLPNVELDLSPDYRDALLWADVLISDFSSVLAEYALTRKPLIYFGSDERVAASHKAYFQSAYPVETWEQVEKVVTDLSRGKDTKYEERIAAVDQVFCLNSGNAGEAIVEYLQNDFLAR